MKFTRLVLALAFSSAACSVQNAFAQGVNQPSAFRPAAYTLDYYAQPNGTESSPSDLAPPPPPGTHVPAPEQGAIQYVSPSEAVACDSCNNVCDSCCDDCCDDCCEDCGPWTLFGGPGPHGFDLRGWINGGITAGPGNPTSYMGPLTFNDRNEIMLNQLYAIADRQIDSSNGWDIGGRIDVLYGTDARFTKAIGLELNQDGTEGWNAGSPFYQLALPQFYAEIGYYDLNVKVGHFYTIIGNEVVTATGNFFYSHAYTMQYGEPFTHTGVLASLPLTDQLSVTGGAHFGWDVFDATTDKISFIGGFNWTSADELVTLAYALTTGDEDRGDGVYTNRFMHSIVANFQLTENLTYLIQSDMGWQDGGNVGNTAFAEWYGINQYLFYPINDVLTAGLRVEWFRDDDGVRVAGVGVNNPSGVGGFAGNFYEISGGLNWQYNANLMIRPEVRWDWYDGTLSLNDGVSLPFGDGARGSQFTAAVDAIFTW